MLRSVRAAARTMACGLVLGLVAGAVRADETVDATAVEFFEKQVRPILVSRCHECHAGENHKANLRLDSRAAVLTGGDTGAAVVPGKPDESLLVDAVRYGDTYQMPPTSQLPQKEIDTLTEWVRRGAAWGLETAASQPAAPQKEFDLAARAEHWSFQPLADAEPPEVDDDAWIRTPVDRFILAKLVAAGLSPAPPADKRTLLRRVTFDLTGLPPTPAEIEAFLADRSADAYANVVDRLLNSPHYGERWARHWLDLVRYAETRGHEFDFEIPDAFRYRDYLIRAFNADVPYDQFVIEHVAGDLLPEPRRHPEEGFNESILATGWYCFGEATHSPVDVRADEANRIDNQIDVFAKTFLGLTVSCARCHDHKFDAISTKDYYALAGYLQSSRYQQAYIDPPEMRAAAIEQLSAINAQRRQACVEFARHTLAPRLAGLADTLLASEVEIATDAADHPNHVLNPWHRLASQASSGTDEFARRRIELAAELTSQPAGDSQPSILFDFTGDGFGGWTPTGEAFVNGPGRPLQWSFAEPRGDLPGRLLTCGAAHSGLISPKLQGVLRSPTFEITSPKILYRVYGNGGRLRLIVDGLELIRNPIYGGLEFAPGGSDPHWHEQDVSKWVGHRAYIELVDDGDGYLALEQVALSTAGPPAEAPNALIAELLDNDQIASREALAAGYQATFDKVFSDWLSTPDATPPNAADRAELIAWIIEQQLLDPEGTKSALAQQNSLAPLADRQREIESSMPAPRTAPGMADGTAENEHVFIRGNHKTLGDEVPRRFLEALGGTEHAPPEQGKGSGRLALARQMVSPACPLVPRVIVNRLWHHHFGAGIVRSPDDFGVMGQPPTHPELLDYLAQDLIASGWSLKHLHRQMVLSSTYQMSSHVDPAADQPDPQNKLWHRMAVRRLEAESIRDAVLFVSGQLDPAMYGPGVMPHLTEFMVGRGRPKDSGPLDGDRRRSIYQAVRRNFLSPMFLAFDYPTPFTTIGRRGTSNVPAQALSLMNNPLVLQQARHWAERVLAEKDATPQARILVMYETALGRGPDPDELAAALSFVEPDDAQSWAELAHVLFNVKEFIYIR